MLVDIGMSETQLWKMYGTSQPNGNQKIVNGTLRFIDFVSIMEMLNYTIVLRDNKTGDEIKVK